MATISRLHKIIGLFCKRALLKRLYCEKETCNFKEPTVDHELFVVEKKGVIMMFMRGVFLCVRVCCNAVTVASKNS